MSIVGKVFNFAVKNPDVMAPAYLATNSGILAIEMPGMIGSVPLSVIWTVSTATWAFVAGMRVGGLRRETKATAKAAQANTP